MAEQTDARSLAQFFFEVGYGAAWADGFIANGELAPFPMTDTTVERAWSIACEAYEDPQEFDAKLAQTNASPDLYDALIKCRKQFDYYRQQHLAKNTPEANVKAIINGEFAAICDAALAKARGEA